MEEGEILQEEHYYPFGLRMEGYGRMVQGLENPYQYNGTEKIEDFDIDWHHTLYRSYDPTLGRWHQIDPKHSERESAYVGLGNNPVLFSDMLGDTIIWSKYMTKEEKRYVKKTIRRLKKKSKSFKKMFKALDKNKDFTLYISGNKEDLPDGEFSPVVGRTVTRRGGKKMKRIPENLGGRIDVGLSHRFEDKDGIKAYIKDLNRLEEHVMSEEFAHAWQVMNDVEKSPMKEDFPMEDGNMEFEAKTIKGIVMTEMGYNDVPSYGRTDSAPIKLGQKISADGSVNINSYHKSEEQWRTTLKATYKKMKYRKGQKPVHLLQLLEKED